jgi:hypothetical protein
MNAAVAELFLLRKAEQNLRSRSPEQTETIRTFSSAADRRLLAARDIAAGALVPATVLIKDALAWSLRAVAVSEDPSLTRQAALDLDLGQKFEALAQPSRNAPPEWQKARDLLTASDPLLFDSMPDPTLDEARNQLDQAVIFVRQHVDARTPRQVTFARWLRVAGAGVAALAVLGVVSFKMLEPTNLARGKPVRTSSLHPQCPSAAPLVDGDVEPTWGIHTRSEQSPWAIIDLEASHAIDRLVVHNRGDGWFADCLPLVVEVSQDGASFTSIGRRTEHFDQSSPWELNANGRAARYVRLRVDRPSYLALSEVEVFSK